MDELCCCAVKTRPARREPTTSVTGTASRGATLGQRVTPSSSPSLSSTAPACIRITSQTFRKYSTSSSSPSDTPVNRTSLAQWWTLAHPHHPARVSRFVLHLPFFLQTVSNNSSRHGGNNSRYARGQMLSRQSRARNRKVDLLPHDLQPSCLTWFPTDRDVVFGVPLRESLRHASVQISTANKDGEMYVWGYIPVVVAKWSVSVLASLVHFLSKLTASGLYLKEKGERCS